MKAVLTVEQPGSRQGLLVLWGAAVHWLSRFTQNKGKVHKSTALTQVHKLTLQSELKSLNQITKIDFLQRQSGTSATSW